MFITWIRLYGAQYDMTFEPYMYSNIRTAMTNGIDCSWAKIFLAQSPLGYKE